MSTVVAPAPAHTPPSITRSTRPSIIPNTSIPLRQVGWPEMLALVEISGWLSIVTRSLAILQRAWRSASRPVLPVTLSGTLAEAGTMMVSGPGQKRRARIKKRLLNSLASSSAITMSLTSNGSERCVSRPLARKTPATAPRLNGSATSVYKASVGTATTLPRRTAAAARSSTSGWGSSGLTSTKSVAMNSLFSTGPDGLGNFDGQLVAAEWRAQLHPLHEGPRTGDHLLGDRDAFSPGLVSTVGQPHPLHKFFGHRHAQFIHHEIRVAVAGERPNSANHRDFETFD